MFGVVCPALSVFMDFAGQPQSVADAVTSASMTHARPQQAVHKARLMAKATTESDAGPTAYPDNLTSLRVSHAILETPAYRFTSNPSQAGSGEYLHNEKPVWHDSSPGSPSYNPPSVRSVVLSTIGGIAATERGERGGRGHEREVR
jgi:hypothetical protein